ncbi:MAG: hypothetical protein GY785_26350 [Gammaproteobacteria bacterium]|nr:hypothetical protein [Gammaproteobacteria bacterium]
MVKQRVNKLQMMAAASLLAMAAASTPANADHDHGVVVPLVTGFALGALAFHGQSGYRQHHYYRYRSHGYRQYRHGRHRSGHYGHKSRQSYSQGGYSHRPRHSYSQGGYHQPRRKH